MYPGDLLCILVTPDLACQGVGRCTGGFRQPVAATPCRQFLASLLRRNLTATVRPGPALGEPC